jgi:hypothetical protein
MPFIVSVNRRSRVNKIINITPRRRVPFLKYIILFYMFVAYSRAYS